MHKRLISIPFSNNVTHLWPVTQLPRKKKSPSLTYFPSTFGACVLELPLCDVQSSVKAS